MNDRYSRMTPTSIFGFLGNAFEGGGDVGASFPRSDAEDMSRGARFIPGEVTLARRGGEIVRFVQKCKNPCCWYWLMEDGTRHYHWDRFSYDAIRRANGTPENVPAGPCPLCKNPHTLGAGEGYDEKTGKSGVNTPEMRAEDAELLKSMQDDRANQTHRFAERYNLFDKIEDNGEPR